jgi:hypothetical protein
MTPDSQAVTGLYINLMLPGGKTAEEISPGTYRIEGLAPTDTIDWATEKKDNPFNGGGPKRCNPDYPTLVAGITYH